MRTVEAAGIIAFFRDREIRYLLLHYRKWNYWGFCKGWVEGESLLEAALRELREETGITEVRVLPGFHGEVSYTYVDDGEIFKTVHYFLGEVFDTDVRLSPEHDEFRWATFEGAMKLLTYDSDKCVLRSAHEFLSACRA